MNSANLADFMRRHALTASDISWVVGVTVRQVRYYLSDSHSVPQAASLLLQAYDEGKIDSRWLVRHLPEKSLLIPVDGVKSLHL